MLLVVSTTLPCIFTAVQILHAKRSPEASASTSITMLHARRHGPGLRCATRDQLRGFVREQKNRVCAIPEESAIRAEAGDTEGVHADGICALATPPSTSMVCSELDCRRRKDGTSAAAGAAAERRALSICLSSRRTGGFSRRLRWPRAGYAMGGPRLVHRAGAGRVPSPSGGHEHVLRWKRESRLAVVLRRRQSGPRDKRVMS